MSERTVRDTIRLYSIKSNPDAATDMILAALGFGPDMPVSELRRALQVWERVKQADAMTYDELGRLIVGDGWDRHLERHMHAENGADMLLAWLLGGES